MGTALTLVGLLAVIALALWLAGIKNTITRRATLFFLAVFLFLAFVAKANAETPNNQCAPSASAERYEKDLGKAGIVKDAPERTKTCNSKAILVAHEYENSKGCEREAREWRSHIAFLYESGVCGGPEDPNRFVMAWESYRRAGDGFGEAAKRAAVKEGDRLIMSGHLSRKAGRGALAKQQDEAALEWYEKGGLSESRARRTRIARIRAQN